MSKVTEAKVKQTCRALYEEGIAVTRDNVAERLGAKGSNTNVFRWIREFKSSLENIEAPSSLDDEVQLSLQGLLDNIKKKNHEKIQCIKAESENRINTLSGELAELEAANFELQKFKDEFLPTLQETQAIINKEREEHDLLRQKYAKSEMKIEKLEEQLAFARKESSDLRKDLTDSFDKYTFFTKEFSTVREQDNDRFESQLDKALNDKRHIEIRLEDTQERLTKSGAINAALNDKVYHLEKALDEADKQLKLQTLYNSLEKHISTISNSNQYNFKNLNENISDILENSNTTNSNLQVTLNKLELISDIILEQQSVLENKIFKRIEEGLNSAKFRKK